MKAQSKTHALAIRPDTVFAERLNQAIAARGVKHTSVIGYVGVPMPYLRAWCEGRIETLRPKTFWKLAYYLRVNPEWLATGDSEIEPERVPQRPDPANRFRPFKASPRG